MIQIAPSILAADFSRLGEQVIEAEKAGAQRIHVDVMDGHFVPNLSMGPVVVEGLRRVTRLPLEVHLMVEDPGRYLTSFRKAGANSLIVHKEVLSDPVPLLRKVRSEGMKVGLAVNPDHPIEALEPFLTDIDLALCMTVHPGLGGQPFLPESPDQIRKLRKMIDQRNPACELEVDGGIDIKTAPGAIQAGATVLVIGTGIFRWPNGPTDAIGRLLGLGSIEMES